MISTPELQLPEPPSDEAFVTCRPFETSWMTTKASLAILDLPGTLLGNSWRFFIFHEPSGTKLWFDLGVSHDLSLYPPRIQEVQHKVFHVQPAMRSPADDVRSIGYDPEEVKYIIASHAHWDHIFPVASDFPNTRVLCGSGTLAWTSQSWPQRADSTFDGRIWDPQKSELPVEEFPSPQAAPEKWQRLGPYANAHDFFGDGSFWIVDAPGHCPGNLAGLARLKTKDGRTKWAFLGGDCFHCTHFMQYPEAPFGQGVVVVPTNTYHEQEEDAREIIRQTAALKNRLGPDLLIWIAHEASLEGVWEIF